MSSSAKFVVRNSLSVELSTLPVNRGGVKKMVKKKLVKKMVKLVFPQHLIKEPVTFKMAKKFDIIPNIRRARVTETVGELVLELDGAEENIEKAMKYLMKLGVDVKTIEADIVD